MQHSSMSPNEAATTFAFSSLTLDDGKDHAYVVEGGDVQEGEGLEQPAGAHHHQQLAVQVKVDLKHRRH